MFSSAIKRVDMIVAFLYLKLSIKNIICYEITKSALELLENNEVKVHYKDFIEIDSRLEEELKDINDIDSAYQIIRSI